ncbi:hypothetical protein RFI02_02020 [Acinetobacter sichuanensis]|uniref:hypothetical protein n=1 Tax=Acinetobacter sichuanensis TaxID=2136183 RepID=UPI00280ECF00|nr:hypothetical protein [Acinetobacter sichuanensis]MDQ9019876.1 hypothetical protein [Acinetobacter sichuanensis]
MDIQKERKAFENWWEALHNGRQIACDYVEEDNSYSVGYANAQWVAWQAAKAVPEGFVLVPREPTDEMIEAFSDGYMDSLSVDFKGASRDGYKAMIEAQEQGHE